MKSVKTFTKNSLSGNYSTQLSELNNKITNIKRLLSYYDVFNIAEVVEDPQEFAVKLNALTPNSSLVINTDPFEYAGVIYSRGDFVLKDINENISHIEAKASGVYTPILNVEENGNLVVTYKYSGEQPSGQIEYDMSEELPSERNTPYSEITYTNIPQNNNPKIYSYSGLVKDWDDDVIETEKEGSTYIVYPVLKFYFQSSDNNFCEEVSLEYELIIQDGKWVLNFVDDNEILKENLYMKVK